MYAGRLVCRSGWYEAIRRGEIPHIRMGRRILIPRQGLERLLSGELAAQGGGPDAA
jgi:excisionase family DNA binding protein